MNWKLQLATLALGIGGAANLALGGLTTATFNFEDQATTTGGGLTSLSLTNNGLSITIDRAGQPFDIANISSKGGTSSFGSRTLAPTPPGANFFNINFNKPISSFSADMGDFGTGYSDALAMTAFTGANGTGKNLGSVSATLPLTSNSVMSIKTLSFSGSNIGSIEMIGGTTAEPNSVYYDNLRASYSSSGSGGTGSGGGSGNGGSGGVSSVPLPPALFVMPFAGLFAWLGSRRLKNARA